MAFLFVIRHARTPANQDNLLIGRRGDHALSEFGEQQAGLLAERLRAEGVATFRTSPLRRAVQTAHVLAGPAGPSPVVDPLLIEREYGKFDELTRPQLLAERARLGLDNADPTGDFPDGVGGVEPLQAVQDRMTVAWQQLIHDEDAPTGLVSHAGTIKALVYRALGIPATQPRAIKVHQASYVRFKIPAPDRLTLHEIWVNPIQ